MLDSNRLDSNRVRQIALESGFELAGIAAAEPAADFTRYQSWVSAGKAGEMAYLTDHRAGVRQDPRQLLSEAKSILCVGKVYNSPQPYSARFNESELAWISRYAWGFDYHDILRAGLERVVQRLSRLTAEPFASRICVDTAPLLERTYARLAGLGWIGRNTCLINQQQGSWFFLGELLLSLDLAAGKPPPDRCGTCRRCIDACPTAALVPTPDGNWALDARLCISYLTIEKRGPIPADLQPGMGHHVFGCDICQDVCPWNQKESFHSDSAFDPRVFAPPLAEMAQLSERDFRDLFRQTPVWRAKYTGFLRNVAIAMGNSGRENLLPALHKLAAHTDAVVAQAARGAITRLEGSVQA